MERNEAIKLIDDRMCFGRGKWSEHHVPEIDGYWEAGQMAIKALEGKDTNVPTTEQTIPVKWIESYLSDCAEGSIVYYVIKGMLIKWREEQEGE